MRAAERYGTKNWRGSDARQRDITTGDVVHPGLSSWRGLAAPRPTAVDAHQSPSPVPMAAVPALRGDEPVGHKHANEQRNGDRYSVEHVLHRPSKPTLSVGKRYPRNLNRS